VAEEIRGPIVICADYRQLQVIHQGVVGALLEEFRQFNSKIRRSALMMPSNIQRNRPAPDARPRSSGALSLAVDAAPPPHAETRDAPNKASRSLRISVSPRIEDVWRSMR
jgi:hypothetical protein